MDVIEAIHTRRSIRSYAPRPVERRLIEEVVWDAAQAPPPFSGQMPWTFNVVEGIQRFPRAAMKHCRMPGTITTMSQDGSGRTDLTLKSSGAPPL